MTAQLSLLDDHGQAHRFGHDTEKAAARTVDAPRLRDAVMQLLRSAPRGLTDDEGADLMRRNGYEGADRLTFGRRRNELQKQGLVVKTSERRPTPHGKSAIVWKAVP